MQSGSGNEVVSWSDTGSNPFDSYKTGDRGFVLDDINEKSITRDDLLALTDNDFSKSLSARYRNKNIYFLEIVVITSLVSPDSYFKSIRNREDPIGQLLGRIDLIVKSDDSNTTYGDEWKYDVYSKRNDLLLSTPFLEMNVCWEEMPYRFYKVDEIKIPKNSSISSGIDDKRSRAKKVLNMFD